MVDHPPEQDAAPPGMPGSPEATSAATPGHGRQAGGRTASRGYLRPGLIALGFLVLAALVINFAGLQHRSPDTLHGSDVATLLSQAVQADQQLRHPPEVTCPESEPVRTGWTFTCRLHSPSGDRTIAVTETDGRARFSWHLVGGS